ncbi:MAG: threonine ammonia-lyase [Pseudomonadota bacterium]
MKSDIFPPISLSRFHQAAELIRPHIIHTPLVHSPTLSRMFDSDIYLKLENLQKTGSFKIRGAANKIFSRRNEISSDGVVAASAGNHAQGVALAASRAGLSATIVMPEWASISKQEATCNYGGQVILWGKSIGESLEKAKEIAAQGKTFIHPFDDVDIITGQGTLGLEILEDLPDTRMILAPVGGGGLIAGIAMAAKALSSGVQVIGVQAGVCPSAAEALRCGHLKTVRAQSSIADGISVRQIGELTFEVLRSCVDRIALVDEASIAGAILMLLERKKILAEGAGAVPLAALLNGAVAAPRGGKLVLVISGGNVDSPLLGRILHQGLLKNGRIMRIQVQLDDTPGSLARLLTLVARQKANVLHIFHDRNVMNVPLFVTSVSLELETRGTPHIAEVFEEIQQAGYQIRGGSDHPDLPPPSSICRTASTAAS